jgi:hypothetical protein
VNTVTRGQFKIRSDLEVVHEPTGVTFPAYPYSNPDDMLRSITVNWGGAEDRSGLIEHNARQNIRHVAEQIFLEQARRNSEAEVGLWPESGLRLN